LDTAISSIGADGWWRFGLQAIRVKEVNMWNEEEYDMVGALEEHDLECESDLPDESDDDLADFELDSEMAEDAVEEDFDEDD